MPVVRAQSVGRSSRLIVVLTGGLGDCLLASPFVRSLRAGGRYERIVCALPAAAAGLYDSSPRVDQVIPCLGSDLMVWGLPDPSSDVFIPYMEVRSAAVDNPEGGRVGIAAEPLFNLNTGADSAVRQVARYHGLSLEDESLEIFTSPEDEQWARKTVAALPRGRIVLIAPDTVQADKSYPRQSWQRVCEGLGSVATVVDLSQHDVPLVGAVPLRPLPTLRQSAALFRRCSRILTVDSFAGHLAAAVGTPAVVLFGPSNPRVFGHAVNVNLRESSCPPCADTARFSSCTDRACVAAIPPERVVHAALAARNLG